MRERWPRRDFRQIWWTICGEALPAAPLPRSRSGTALRRRGPGVWRRYRAFYNGLVETVDREIGTVLSALERTQVPRITVFSTDHGDLGGAHGLPYKGPAMYEELVRVPLVIAWPGRIRAARSDALVSLIDLLPTLCDLAAVPPPAGIDGVSLRPILEQRAARVREMVFADDYGKQSWRVPIRMVRTERWKYVRYVKYGDELYDLSADPGELRNLAADPDAARERMRLSRELDDWMRRTGDPFPSLTTTDRSGAGGVRVTELAPSTRPTSARGGAFLRMTGSRARFLSSSASSVRLKSCSYSNSGQYTYLPIAPNDALRGGNAIPGRDRRVFVEELVSPGGRLIQKIQRAEIPALHHARDWQAGRGNQRRRHVDVEGKLVARAAARRDEARGSRTMSGTRSACS